MNAHAAQGPAAVHGVLDADGHLVQADPRLAALHQAAGGRPGGMLAVPQVAALARLARRLGIPISRLAHAAEDDHDLELWVRAVPQGDSTTLAITGWTRLPPRGGQGAADIRQHPEEGMGAGEWSWETDDGLRLTNIAAEGAEAAGKAREDLIGRPLTSLFRFREHEDGALPILLALAERRRFEDQRAELRTEGREIYRLSGFPLLDGSGRFAGFHGAALPEPKEASTAEQALRAPLDRIISQAESIGAATDGPLSDAYAAYAADIASAGRHLMALVDDIEDMQAVDRPGARAAADPIDLAAVARQAATLLAVRAGERQVTLAAPPPDIALPATGDPRRVFQILVNLIGNAIRYAPAGGSVDIAGEMRDGTAAISVTDRGRGIDPADQERVFGKFERVDPSEPGGTGLGLYIARGLARSMGGDIALTSAPGLGARFTLTLPAQKG